MLIGLYYAYLNDEARYLRQTPNWPTRRGSPGTEHDQVDPHWRQWVGRCVRLRPG